MDVLGKTLKELMPNWWGKERYYNRCSDGGIE
jgi:hypothetical protein